MKYSGWKKSKRWSQTSQWWTYSYKRSPKEMLQQCDRWVTVGSMKKGIWAMIRHWWFGGRETDYFRERRRILKFHDESKWIAFWFIWINMAPGEESSRGHWQSEEIFSWLNWRVRTVQWVETGMLLNILGCSKQPPKNYPAQDVNSASTQTLGDRYRQTIKAVAACVK